MAYRKCKTTTAVPIDALATILQGLRAWYHHDSDAQAVLLDTILRIMATCKNHDAGFDSDDFVEKCGVVLEG